MTDYCSYHPKEPAIWHCPNCPREFGECCIPSPLDFIPKESCPLCTTRLTFLGASNKVEPFWMRPLFFLRYPWNQNGIIALIALSLLTTLVSSISAYDWLLGLTLSLIFSVIWFSYLFNISQSIAQGDYAIPDIRSSFNSKTFKIGIKVTVLPIILFLIALFLLFINLEKLVLFFVALGVVTFPAFIILLTQEQSVRTALNPVRQFYVIKNIGWPYALLYLILVVTTLLAGLIIGGLGLQVDPRSTVVALLLTTIISYFYVVMMAMIGYCLHQYQYELGFSPITPDLPQQDEAGYQHAKIIGQSQVYLAEQRYEETASALRPALEKQPQDLEFNRLYHQLILATQETDRLQRHGQHFIQLLMEANLGAEAMKALLAIREQCPHFIPKDADLRFRLAEQLERHGHSKLAVMLLKDLHSQAPDFQGLPEAYLLAAKILSEKLGRDKQALALLKYVQKRFPNCACHSEIDSYQRVIEKLLIKRQDSD